LAVPDEILIFLVGGGIGIFVLTIVIKMVKSWWITNRILRKTIQDQQSHWENHVRPEFKRLMVRLFYDIKGITERYYPNCDGYSKLRGLNTLMIEDAIWKILHGFVGKSAVSFYSRC
jgi:hypothetical protein